MGKSTIWKIGNNKMMNEAEVEDGNVTDVTHIDIANSSVRKMCGILRKRLNRLKYMEHGDAQRAIKLLYRAEECIAQAMKLLGGK